MSNWPNSRFALPSQNTIAETFNGSSQLTPIDLQLATVVTDWNAAGSAATFTGSIVAGSRFLTITGGSLPSVVSDFQAGQGIYIAGAAVAGGNLITTVEHVGGPRIRLADAAATSVTGALVQHDDTLAIQLALDNLGFANGGTLLFPAGFYRVNGPKGSFNSILKLPFNPAIIGTNPGPPQPQYQLIGQNFPVLPVFWPAPTDGAIIQSDIQDPTCSILAGGLYSTGTGLTDINASALLVDGLTFRTYDNPNLNGLDFGTLTTCVIRNTLIDTGQPGKENNFLGGHTPSGSQPTHGTFGLRMARVNMASGMNLTENVSVNLFGIGIIGSELWHSRLTYMQRCMVGVQGHETAANYGISGDFLIIQCPTGFYFPATCDLDCHVEFENDPSGGWWSSVAGRYIYDPTDVVTGWLKFINVAAGSGGGAATDISLTGCSGLSVISLRGGFGSKIVGFQAKGGSPSLDVTNLNVHGILTLNDGAAQQPVSFGAADSSSSGFRQLRAPNSSSTPSLLTGLVSYWKMDESTGATRVDQLTTNNLADSGTCPAVSGKIANAAHATTGQFLQVSHNASQNFSGSMSIAGWMNITTLGGSSGFHSLLTKTSGAADTEFFLVWRNDLLAWQWNASANGSTVVSCAVTATPTVGTWYHVAAVFDMGASQLRLRINDGAVGSQSASLTGPLFASTIQMSSMLLFFGSALYGDCAVDELGLWNKALSLAEITALYNGNTGLSYPF